MCEHSYACCSSSHTHRGVYNRDWYCAAGSEMSPERPEPEETLQEEVQTLLAALLNHYDGDD